jgi:hypothetical protein
MLNKMTPGSQIETVVNDATADDSDKSFTPTSRWRIQSIFVTLVTTVEVGDRQLVVRIKEGSDIIYQSVAGAVQAASATVNYNFAPNNTREGTAVANALDVPLPADLHLSPGQTIQVLDATAVDAAADDMTVRILAEVF